MRAKREKLRKGELLIRASANTETELEQFLDSIEENWEIVSHSKIKVSYEGGFHVFTSITPFEEVS